MKQILNSIITGQKKPTIFEYTDVQFWNDPHISKQMLKAHLSPNHDLASRKPETILKTVNHLFETGTLKKGMRILDLGCGPGLYSELIQSMGVQVVGVDISENSIEYANERNIRLGLGIEYIQMDFFEMKYENEFDMVLQIYGEINTFSPRNRDHLLKLIYRALKKEGLFVFDSTTRYARNLENIDTNWYAADSGFWSDEPHLVLEQNFDYPEESTWLDQSIVLDTNGLKVYRNWFNDHDLSSVKNVVENNGFLLEKYWGDLTGTPYTVDGKWIGVVAKKK